MHKTRGQKRAAKTRQKLKAAALDIFSEKTVDATTIDEITQKADVGKGTLYQHFSDKEQIVVSLVDDTVNHLIERMNAFEARPESLEGMLEHLLDVHYVFSLDSKEEFLLFFQGRVLLKLQSDTLDELEEPYMRYLEAIERLLSLYLPPRINAIRVRRLACAVAGFVFGYLSFAMIGMTDEEIEPGMKSLKRVFVQSLCTFLGR
jgi:AcrR family transcriptional regulator